MLQPMIFILKPASACEWSQSVPGFADICFATWPQCASGTTCSNGVCCQNANVCGDVSHRTQPLSLGVAFGCVAHSSIAATLQCLCTAMILTGA